MKIWEYLFIEFFYEEQVTYIDGAPAQEGIFQLIHQSGREGWELISMTETRTSLLAVLKR